MQVTEQRKTSTIEWDEEVRSFWRGNPDPSKWTARKFIDEMSKFKLKDKVSQLFETGKMILIFYLSSV